MKTIAIMQPYFLPYLGYFQLIAAVDKFVVLDDVNFIQRGWINRNRMLMNGAPHLFTLPLRGASQNRLICDLELVDDGAWRNKLLRTLHQAYGRAPYYAQVSGMLDDMLGFPSVRLDLFLLHSLQLVMRYLGLDTALEPTSRSYGNAGLSGEQRIIDICRREGASDYINPIGGVGLYQGAHFEREGIALHFLQSRPVIYPQGKNQHISGLSIIDVLMYNAPVAVQHLLKEKDLLQAGPAGAWRAPPSPAI